MLEFRTKRDLYLDSSVMVMGKGAGNLNTELLLEHLNLYYNGQLRDFVAVENNRHRAKPHKN